MNNNQVAQNSISKDFGVISLLTFAMPTIIMMIFMSLYTMVDGAFVSQFVGSRALSAVNIVYPVISIIVALGIMFATGGSALIAKKLGENNAKGAREDFSFLLISGIIIGLFMAIFCYALREPILKFLGATESIYEYCYDYLVFLVPFFPFAMLQMLFQYFFVTAGKPGLGMFVTILGGIANIILDYIFIVPMAMGIKGAAIATGIGYSIPAIYGLIYFFFNKNNSLYITPFKFSVNTLLESSMNGSSEMVTHLSTAITTYLFNIISLKYLGVDGVAAITIILYSQFLLTALYLGYSSGVAPIISYNYGFQNHKRLKKVYKISIIFILIGSISTFFLASTFSQPIIKLFVHDQQEVLILAQNGFDLFSIAYLFMGINIFASALFTALSNGKVSAIISFLRTFAFIIPAIIILPKFIGSSGIWLSVPVAEASGILFSIMYLIKHKKEYQY